MSSTPRSDRSLDGDSPITEYSIDDVTFLDRPTTDNITNLLESRYNKKDQSQKKSPQVYTYLGDALIFVNPNDIKETEGLYKNSVMHFYHKKLPFARAPHIFSIAENAFRTMKETRQPQTIIVNGESGSGKTESSKLILKYLTVVSQNGPSSYFVKHVLTESNQLLEAFGNAKTLHCDNSSRFGKYTTVYFGFGDRIEGGKISTILLEKSHITNQRKKERNFHIFYQLCRGADRSMKEEFNLHDPSEFLYLNSTETVIDGVDDMREFKKTIKSMDSIGFSSNDRKEIFRVVAGILHLGNIQFLEGNSKDRAEIVENDALKWASLCLGVQPNQLKHALLARTLNTEEKVVTFQTAVQARFNRDALAKGIYERLFLWIVQKINSVIKPKTKKMVTKIGILDLYGFEIYPSDNSLEQLNINFVNEKLQQHTLKLLQQEKDEYVKEGIFNMDLFTILSKELKKDFLSDFDTINDCISCIEDKPLGIYSLLDEEDYLNVSGDERYLAKLKENLKKSNSFEPARFKSTTFSLKHFAAKVDYNVTDWVKKNKDTLFKDLIDAMCKSSSDLVQELFKPLDDFYSGRESKRRLQETIVKQFKRDVNKLMNKKLKGKIHFIYCIKPNYEKKALKFDKKLITNQVKCLGLSSISIFKQHGFFFKMDYPKFFAKYKALSPKTWPSSSADFDIEELKSKIRSILAETKIESNNYAFGKTEIFLKTP
ncbi:myosin, partial [Naegleria gruberi]|eukprot:XP_002676561.1 myosin [Naegleria gruberi]